MTETPSSAVTRPAEPSRLKKTALVAAIQTAPVFLDTEASLTRLARWTEQAARRGAELVLFPPAYLPGYPFGWDLTADPALTAAWRKEGLPALAEQAVEVPSPLTARLGALARAHNLHLAVGVIERIGRTTPPRLACSLLIFDPRGDLIGRQSQAAAFLNDPLVLGQETDGKRPPAQAAPEPRAPALPLARVYLPFRGMELYLAPSHEQGRAWQDTMRHVAQVGDCFVVSSSPYLRDEFLPTPWRRLARDWGLPAPHLRGGSAIVSPYGGYLAGPLYDQEGLLLARLHPLAVLASPWKFDPARINAEVVRRTAGDSRPGPVSTDWPVAWRASEAGESRLVQEKQVIAAMLSALLDDRRVPA